MRIRREALIPLRFLFSVDIDLHRRDATGSHAFGGQADWTNAQRQQIVLHAQGVRSKIEQAGQQHIASDAAGHFDKEGAHAADVGEEIDL